MPRRVRVRVLSSSCLTLCFLIFRRTAPCQSALHWAHATIDGREEEEAEVGTGPPQSRGGATGATEQVRYYSRNHVSMLLIYYFYYAYCRLRGSFVGGVLLRRLRRHQGSRRKPQRARSRGHTLSGQVGLAKYLFYYVLNTLTNGSFCIYLGPTTRR